MFEVIVTVQAMNGGVVDHTVGPVFESKDAALSYVAKQWRGSSHKVSVRKLA